MTRYPKTAPRRKLQWYAVRDAVYVAWMCDRMSQCLELADRYSHLEVWSNGAMVHLYFQTRVAQEMYFELHGRNLGSNENVYAFAMS